VTKGRRISLKGITTIGKVRGSGERENAKMGENAIAGGSVKQKKS